MNLEPGTLIAGLFVSTIGLSLFLFGKKQSRIPQLAGGLLLMGLPMCVPSPWWMSATAATVIAGVWFALRHGL